MLRPSFEKHLKKGHQYIKQQNYECAFKELKKGQLLCAKAFGEEDTNTKLKSLNNFYEAYENIVDFLRESSCCESCIEKEMNYCYSSFLNIHNYEKFNHQVRLHALKFLREIYKDKVQYLSEKNKDAELNQFKNYHFSSIQPLLLVNE